MARKPYAIEEKSKSSLLKMVVAGAVLLGMAFLIWYATANRSALEENLDNPPLIVADIAPVKVRAEGESGAQIRNQDKDVFNLLTVTDPVNEASRNQVHCDTTPDGQVRCGMELAEEQERIRVQIENARKAEEQAQVEAEAAMAALVASDKAKAQSNQISESVAEAKAAVDAEKKVLEAKKDDVPSPAKKAVADDLSKLIASESKPAETVKKAPEKAVTAPAVKPASAIAAGQWGVQLASFKTQEDADRAANKFLTDYKETLNGLKAVVQKADISSGVVYRVRFFGISSADKAQNTCEALKKRGQGCLAVKS